MSFKELARNRKLSPKLRMAVMQLDDGADPDQPRFSALLQTSTGFTGVAGADIHTIAGNICTARNITLNGLKNLVGDDKVSYIEGATPMFPEQSAARKGPRP